MSLNGRRHPTGDRHSKPLPADGSGGGESAPGCLFAPRIAAAALGVGALAAVLRAHSAARSACPCHPPRAGQHPTP